MGVGASDDPVVPADERLVTADRGVLVRIRWNAAPRDDV
jgi:hypothetical protein